MKKTCASWQIAALLLVLSLTSVGAPVRIGIISSESATSAAADILTAGLSSATNVVLVERAELDRVFREQSIGKTDFARLGKLVRADGLIFLQTIFVSDQTNMAIRLVAVNNGVVIDSTLQALPVPDIAQWQRLILEHYAPLLGKLATPRERAIPISLINFRSAASTPAAVRLEQTLSALLAQRLARENELFVLDRRRLGKLAWEKDLAGPDDQQFWTGAYLLEGVIDRDGVAPNTVTVQARISPSGGKALEVEASGPRDNPAEVTENLARRILDVLQRHSRQDSWNPQREADRFAEEAAWAERWKIWPEAYIAADSAYALGHTTETVAALKINALTAQFHTPDRRTYVPMIRSWVDDPGWVFDIVRRAGWNESDPNPVAAPFVREALELYIAHCLSTGTNRWQTNAAWLDTGLDSLQKSFEVLRHHYFHDWRQGRFDPAIPEIRSASQKVWELVRDALPAAGSAAVSNRFERYTGVYSPLWQETPEQTVALYRSMIDSGAFGRVRNSILVKGEPLAYSFKNEPRSWVEPFWVGWTAADRERGQTVWKQFLADLQKSTNRVTRAEGALLQLRDSVFDPDIALATELYYDATMDPAHSRFSTEIDGPMNETFDAVLRDTVASVGTLRRQRLVEAWKAHSFARTKLYLQTTPEYDTYRVNNAFAAFKTAEEAREVLPVFESCAKRFPLGDGINTFVGQLRTRVNELQPVPQPTSQPVIVTNAPAAPMAPAAPTQVVRTISAPQNVPVLNITRGYHRESGMGFAGVSGLKEREGHMLASIRNAMSTVIVEIDFETGDRRTVVQAPPSFGYQFSFELFNGDLFWIEDASTISRRAFTGGTPQLLKVDVPLERAMLTVVDKRLFIVSDQYIGEFVPAESMFRTLASARRRPAANALDSWPWTGRPIIGATEGGVLAAAFDQTRWVTSQSDWTMLPNIQFKEGETFTLLKQGGLFIANVMRVACADRVMGCDGSEEYLLSDDVALLPRWQMPFDFELDYSRRMNLEGHYFDGTNLAILKATRVGTTGHPITPGAVLQWFDSRWEMPETIYLGFSTESGSFVEFTVLKSVLPTIEFSSRGLLFLVHNIGHERSSSGGIWFLPWNDLEDWLKKNRPESHNLSRREPARRKFDLNHDGRLDANELQAMEQDSTWKAGEEAFQGRRLLATYDANNDGKLDLSELATLTQTSQMGLSTQLPGIPMPRMRSRVEPSSLLSRFDKNQNGTLEVDELGTLYSTKTRPEVMSFRSGWKPGTNR